MKELERKLIEEFMRHMRTREELDHMREGIEHLEAALYHHNTQSFFKVLREELPEGVSKHLESVLTAIPYAENRTLQEELLGQLKKGLKWVRSFKIEFAFEPSELLIEKVTEWVRREVGDAVVLDIGVDLSMLGGARISYNGKYEEYTLHHLIERVLAKKQAEILNLVHYSSR